MSIVEGKIFGDDGQINLRMALLSAVASVFPDQATGSVLNISPKIKRAGTFFTISSANTGPGDKAHVFGTFELDEDNQLQPLAETETEWKAGEMHEFEYGRLHGILVPLAAPFCVALDTYRPGIQSVNFTKPNKGQFNHVVLQITPELATKEMFIKI